MTGLDWTGHDICVPRQAWPQKERWDKKELRDATQRYNIWAALGEAIYGHEQFNRLAR